MCQLWIELKWNFIPSWQSELRMDTAAKVLYSSSYTKYYYFINFKNMFYIKTGNIKKAQLISEHNISQMTPFHINLHLLA